LIETTKVAETSAEYTATTASRVAAMKKDQIVELIAKLEKEMREASKALEFERAADLRDMIVELRDKIGQFKLEKGRKRKVESRTGK
jgi:excinuclease ABC subunit B